MFSFPPSFWLDYFSGMNEYPRVELLGQKVYTFLLLSIHIAKLLSSRIIPIYIPLNSVRDKEVTIALPAWRIISFKIFFVNVIIIILYLTVILIVFSLKVIQWAWILFHHLVHSLYYLQWELISHIYLASIKVLALFYFKLSGDNHFSCSWFTIVGGTRNTQFGPKWNAYPS